MKFLQTAILMFAVLGCSPALAQDTDLRGSANAAADAAKDEVADNETKEVAEKIIETTVAEGETLPAADAGVEDGVDDCALGIADGRDAKLTSAAACAILVTAGAVDRLDFRLHVEGVARALGAAAAGEVDLQCAAALVSA